MHPPLKTISLISNPSRFTPKPVSGFTTSACTIPIIITPCLAFSLACSIAGSLFHSGFHAHGSMIPAVSVIPYS
ncbi:hypothetical protein ACFX2K_034518 [Malus domestica]